MACFYVIDEDGVCVGDDICGCINEFSTFRQAKLVAMRISRHNSGRYSVTVAIPTVIFEDGKEVEW